MKARAELGREGESEGERVKERESQREREGEREGEGQREGGREGERILIGNNVHDGAQTGVLSLLLVSLLFTTSVFTHRRGVLGAVQ